MVGCFSNLPAFFSCSVRSDQLSFMRSRRAIHRSACSCMGIPSHLFSMLASVGFEMAWVEAARQARVAVGGRAAARAIVLRSTVVVGVRSILDEVVVHDKSIGSGDGSNWLCCTPGDSGQCFVEVVFG
jgi:O-succinylbenzoate synthase